VYFQLCPNHLELYQVMWDYEESTVLIATETKLPKGNEKANPSCTNCGFEHKLFLSKKQNFHVGEVFLVPMSLFYCSFIHLFIQLISKH
jgi:hypothetical protein